MPDAVLALLAAVAGAIASVAGFGIGSLLTPAVAIGAGTKAAVAIVALPHALATAIRLWAMRKEIDVSILRSFGLASAAGGLAGALLHAAFSSAVLGFVLGVLLIGAGSLELSGLGRAIRFGGRSSFVAGVASGLFGGLVGNQGGIRAAALLRFDLSRQGLVATATATALLVDAARLPVYVLVDGPSIAAHASTVGVLAVGVVVGTFVGTPILRRLPEPVFRRGLAVLLILLGIALVVGSAAPGRGS